MKIIDTIRKWSLSIATTFAQIVLLFMVVIVAVEVIMRWCLGVSTGVSTDFAAYGMGIVFYWGGLLAIEDDVFVRVDVLYDLYKGRLKKVLNIIYDFILLFFNSAVFYYFSLLLMNTFERNLKATNIYQTPLWVPRLLVQIGIGLLEIYLICRTVEDFTAKPAQHSNRELRLQQEINPDEGGI